MSAERLLRLGASPRPSRAPAPQASTTLKQARSSSYCGFWGETGLARRLLNGSPVSSTYPDDSVLSAALAIKRYLAERPEAFDTADGVAHWWLSRQRLCDSLVTVQHALEHLELTGDIVRVQSDSGTTMYRRSLATR